MAFIFVNEGQSIQAAINAAQPGDTILVGSGTYNESINVNVAGLTIQAFDTGGGPPVIEGPIMDQLAVPDGTSLNEFFEANNPAYSSSTGVTIAANGVTIEGITITGWSTGVNLGSSDGVTISSNTFVDNITGLHKGTEANVTDITISDNSFSQGIHGMTIYAASNGNGAFDGVVMNGNDFSELSEKGMYFEQISNATLTGNVFDDVGNFGRVSPPFGGTQGEFGQAIDINLKFETYENVTFTNTTITNSGNSNQDGEGPTGVFGAAIGVKIRDDGPSYSGNPADFDGAIIFDGLTIDGTSTGVRVGEPGKNNLGPDVTLIDVTITNATVGEVDNATSATAGGTITAELSATQVAFDAAVSQADVDVTGNGLANTITTGSGEDSIAGGSGNDTLDGGAGDDSLAGGAGLDTLHGGDGADVLAGGADNDSYYLSGDATIVEAVDGGVDTVYSSVSHTLASNVENLVLAEVGGSDTEDFENFDLGPIANGENGWVHNGVHDVEIVNLGGNNVFRMSSDPVSGDFGGPYSPELAVTAGEPQTSADGSVHILSFTIRAVSETSDNSRLEIDLGTSGATDRNNFMVIESIAGQGVRIAVADPLLDGNFDTGEGLNNFAAFTGNRTLVDGLDPAQWYEIELRVTYVDGPDNDVIEVYVNGVLVGTTTTFENYRDAIGGTHEDNAEANQTNRIFFRAGNGGQPQDGPGGANQGFYIDNISNTVVDQFSGTGNALNNNIQGNSGDNLLSGLDGDDMLFGAAGNDVLDGGVGSDTLDGGAGNDTYLVNDATTVVENADGGEDAVEASISHTLAANVENLILTGAVAINGDGNAEDNTIEGNAQNNILSGHGGADTLIGGDGDDTLDGGADADSLDGGAGEDSLYGDSADVLTGGADNDSYYLSGAATVVEAADGGVDTVYSSVLHTLAANVENLVLTGVNNIAANGNDAGNSITGNQGDNTLGGLDGEDVIAGGAGNDSLDGGDGSDTLEGGEGDDNLEGGVGVDTAVYAEAVTVDQLTANGSTWTVTSPPEEFNGFSSAALGFGSDTLSGVEIVQSSSGNILLVGSGGFATIQEAVDAAQVGDTIMVAAGEYNETVTVDIDVTILGANHGVAGNGERGDESVVTGGFLITADGVSVDGFEITGGVPEILFGGDRPYGVFIAGDNASVINNVFSGAAAGDAGPFGAASTASGFDISDNSVNDWQQGGYIFDGADGAIHDNLFADNANGVVTESLLTIIHDNTFEGSTDADIAATPLDDVNVTSIIYDNTHSVGLNRPITVFLNGPNGQSVVGSNTATTYRADAHNGSATILAGTGSDTLSWAGASQVITADLAAGTSSAPFGVVNFTGIENVTGGSANDTLSGSTGANTLNGGAGQDTLNGLGGADSLYGGDDADALNGGGDNDWLFGQLGDDTLNGGAGTDAMSGGEGNDTYVVDAGGDAITEAENEGTDLVQSSVTYTLAANVENLTLTGVVAINGIGNGLGNILTGNSAANTLSGLGGADYLSAGGGLDSLFGGDGDDLLEGGNDADSLDGGNDHDTLNGGSGNDSLLGRAGNDTLNGGTGADAMQGGVGDDTYVVDDGGDTVTEFSGAGTDTVQSSLTYGLGAFVENLTLTGVAAINGSGNILANVLTGNIAANTFTGGAEDDTLHGNGGNDTLFGGNGEDVLNGGDDDDLLDGGNDADTLNGGDGADTVYGRTADDVLNGGDGEDTVYGGDGNDTIDGGEGNDLLDGLNNDDVIEGGGGDDEIYGRQNNDTLTGGAGNDDLYGGDGDDTIDGGADDDLLDGGNGIDIMFGGDGADELYGRNGNDVLNGGLGADTLFGGNDQDTFVFSTALGAGNIDAILSFNVADDAIHLDISVFTGIGLGALDIDAFIVGTAAADAEDRIIYDSATGALYYDADGVGGVAAIQFATLSAGLGLTSSDLFGIPGGP